MLDGTRGWRQQRVALPSQRWVVGSDRAPAARASRVQAWEIEIADAKTGGMASAREDAHLIPFSQEGGPFSEQFGGFNLLL